MIKQANNSIRISIITPSFNSEATIGDTLESIASQDYKNIEHIIVDGKSTDETLNIINRFPHVAKIISEPDKGLYDAMNKGIRVAKGNVIGILNSDDVYTNSSIISNIAQKFQRLPVMALYADLQYVAADNINKVVRTWKSGRFNEKYFYYGWMPPHPTFFVRKELYEQYGLFNTTLISAADYELMLRFLVKYKIQPEYLPEIIVKMRTGGMSNAHWLNRLRANKEDALAWKLNNLHPYFFTRYLKPLRKSFQFFLR